MKLIDFMGCSMVIIERGECFTHKDNDGTYRTFLIEPMRAWAKKTIKPIVFPFPQYLYDHIMQDMGIEEDRVKRLREPFLSEPLVSIQWPDETLTIVDGNHRAVKLFRQKNLTLCSYVIPYPVWEQFLAVSVQDPEELLHRRSGMIEHETSKAMEAALDAVTRMKPSLVETNN